MDDFLQILLSFPTIVFTLALAIVTVFWVVSLLGALDVDVLDADVDLDVDVDVDVDAEVDVDADGASAGDWTSMAQLLRLGKVPVTVTLSLLALGGFVTSFVLCWVAGAVAGAPLTAIGGVGVLLIAGVGGIATANAGSRPLEPVFRTVSARSNRALVGEVCTVTTGRVDERFGQAEIVVDTDHLTIQVRCDTAGAALPRGSQALIVHFDPRREAFVVEPLATSTTTNPEV